MSATKKAIIEPEKIHLLTVKVFKVNFEASEDFRNSNSEVESYTTDTGMDSAFNFKEKQCRIRLFLKLTAVDENNEPMGLYAEYGIEFHYKVENMESFLHHEKGDSVTIDGILGSTLAGISFSTARGIVLERLQGTYFDGVILPVIDPKELVKSENGLI